MALVLTPHIYLAKYIKQRSTFSKSCVFSSGLLSSSESFTTILGIWSTPGRLSACCLSPWSTELAPLEELLSLLALGRMEFCLSSSESLPESESAPRPTRAPAAWRFEVIVMLMLPSCTACSLLCQKRMTAFKDCLASFSFIFEN